MNQKMNDREFSMFNQMFHESLLKGGLGASLTPQRNMEMITCGGTGTTFVCSIKYYFAY